MYLVLCIFLTLNLYVWFFFLLRGNTPWCLCGGQRTTCGWFSPSGTWVPGIKLRHLHAWRQGTFTLRYNSLALILCLSIFFLSTNVVLTGTFTVAWWHWSWNSCGRVGRRTFLLNRKARFQTRHKSSAHCYLCADGKNVPVSSHSLQSVLSLSPSLKMYPVNALFIIGSTLGKAVLIWQLTLAGEQFWKE